MPRARGLRGCFTVRGMLNLTILNPRLEWAVRQTQFAQALLPGGPTNPWGGLLFWQVIVGLAAVLGIIVAILVIRSYILPKPALTDLATKAELSAVKKAMEEMERNIATNGQERERVLTREIAQQRVSLTEQIGRLHERINNNAALASTDAQAIQRQLGEVIGQMKSHWKTT